MTNFFKGSITEAISLSRINNKILLIYVRGSDEQSSSLDQFTWANPLVADRLDQCCCALRLEEGSPDALNFSAIFPVRTVPTVALIGDSGGVLDWIEGIVSPEDFLNKLQRANSTFQANLLCAGLAPTQPTMSTADQPLPDVAPGDADMPSTNTSPSLYDPVAAAPGELADPGPSAREAPHLPADGAMSREEAPSPSFPPSQGGGSGPPAAATAEQTTTPGNNLERRAEGTSSTLDVDVFQPSPDLAAPLDQEVLKTSPDMEKAGAGWRPVGGNLGESSEEQGHGVQAMQQEASSANSAGESGQQKGEDGGDVARHEKVQLQFRLTDGSILRASFTPTTTLQEARAFVDQKRTDGLGSYVLATSFPRKTFSGDDNLCTLMDLQLVPTATLILVPSGGAPAAASSAQAENAQGGGLISILGGALSWLNPLSYLRVSIPVPSAAAAASAGTASGQEHAGRWGQGSLRTGAQADSMAPFAVPVNRTPLSASGGGTSSGRTRHPVSNVHTLNHNSRDEAPDGNQYWNGNSVQFGADGPDAGKP